MLKKNKTRKNSAAFVFLMLMLTKRVLKVTDQKLTHAKYQSVFILQNRPKTSLDATNCGWNNSFTVLHFTVYGISISAVLKQILKCVPDL